MLLEEIGYVVEAVCIFGRTTAVMRQLLFRLMTHPHCCFMKNKRNTLKKYPDFFGNYEYSAYLCKI